MGVRARLRHRNLPGHVAAVEWRRKRAKAYARRELAPILTCAWALNPGEPDGGVVRMESLAVNIPG